MTIDSTQANFDDIYVKDDPRAAAMHGMRWLPSSRQGQQVAVET